MLFDTHAHYYDKRFDADRDELLASMPENGVGYIINAGCDVETTKKCIEIAEKYDFIYATSGVHPNHSFDMDDSAIREIGELAKHPRVKAIGEIGLDYFREFTPHDVQREVFAKQIALADEVKLPIVIHCRQACKDVLDILKSDYKGGGALLHCFSESKETAKILLDMGVKIAIGGTVTYPNNVRTVDAVKYIPLESLVIETDCPYLTPHPNRNKRNSSLYIHYVAEKIAEIKGVSVEEVVEATTNNAKNFFGIE